MSTARDLALDEMVVSIAGKPMYLLRAVDADGEVLEVLIQRKREHSRRGPSHAQAPETAGVRADGIVMDRLRSVE